MAVALILAAGAGRRLAAGRPKALVRLAGRPMLEWSLAALSAAPAIERIVLALPAGVAAPAGLSAVEGGASRSESVRAALGAAGPGDPVLVHDAARPLVSVELIERVLEALAERADADAAIAALPVTDTIKRVGEGAVVEETLERSRLWAVQTPQVFRRAALEGALAAPAAELTRATDDAWLVERAGGRVIVVAGSEENLKVTSARDLRVAEGLLEERAARTAPGVGERRLDRTRDPAAG